MTEEESSHESSHEGKTKEVKTPCPVPEEHIKVFSGCCDKFQKGEISELEVIEEVVKTLKQLKKPDVEPAEST